jgi:DNA gyrase inhibitor GyrI
VEETQGKAGALLDELQSELPAGVCAAAQARGRARDLAATVRELLAEP